MGGPTPPKKKRKIRRFRPAGPAPRAAFAIDAVLTRTGAIEIRRQFIGPKNVEPEDIINLVSGIVAAWVSTAFRNMETRAQVKDMLLDSLDRRITTATVSDIEEDESGKTEIEGEEK